MRKLLISVCLLFLVGSLISGFMFYQKKQETIKATDSLIEDDQKSGTEVDQLMNQLQNEQNQDAYLLSSVGLLILSGITGGVLWISRRRNEPN
ncbi:hypothetical protein [Bacillus sp. LR_5]|uniref:hypothetical protein n=1 Tax=Bacillus sp. LR_5 TaxID=3055784 RepID=UPI00090CA7CB|nr:hypothetical protein BAX60_02020 [Bacillus subtilis]